MRQAGFGDDHEFATKGQIARDQAHRALDAGLQPAWATGDEVYGRSSELREVFEAHGIGYVFAARVGAARRDGVCTTGRGSPPPARSTT